MNLLQGDDTGIAQRLLRGSQRSQRKELFLTLKLKLAALGAKLPNSEWVVGFVVFLSPQKETNAARTYL